MLRFFKIPVLTCSLLFALTQSLPAQTGNKPATSTTTGTGTSVGNDSDISGGTTNAHSKNDNPKRATNSKHCTAKEDFVKQGDHMVCVPKSATDNGLPMGKEKTQQNPQ